MVQADRVGLYCAEVGERGRGGGLGVEEEGISLLCISCMIDR